MKNSLPIHNRSEWLCVCCNLVRHLTAGILHRTVLLLWIVLLATRFAAAQETPPPAAPTEDDVPNLMKVLSDQGLHNIESESWNLYGQFTYISSWKPSFQAKYTNLNGSTNSLLPSAERSFTGTATLFLGLRLWQGGEVYVVPELLSQRAYSGLKGLGGAIQNFELQKGGGETPQIYHSRAYFRQIIGLGGHKIIKESGPLQLGASYDTRRLVLIAGNFSVLDFFDKGPFNIDPRRNGLLSLGFLTNAAYDFASDARGYSYGGVAELYWDNWAVRFARLTPPKDPNGLPVDFRLFKYHGDQIELEHRHQIHGQNGMIRALAYRNWENIGRFKDAIAAFEADPHKNATTCTTFNYGSGNANAPDLCWVRRPDLKVGVGLYGEQYIARGIGVFARGMISDGKSEVYAYTAADRSASAGVMATGATWKRPGDTAGIGLNLGWISKDHIEYLRLGGVDGFIGDGTIRPGTETSFDMYYSVNVQKWFWVSGDFQRILNPGFNTDRGPLNVFSVRIHGEF